MSTRPRDRPGESGGVRGCPPHLGLRVDAEKAVKKDPNTPVICPSQRRESFRLARRPRRLRADASESATREKRRSRARDDSRTDPRSRRYAASDPPRGERWPFLTFSAKSPSRGDSTPRAAHAQTEASLFPGSERRTFTTRRHPCPRGRARERAPARVPRVRRRVGSRNRRADAASSLRRRRASPAAREPRREAGSGPPLSPRVRLLRPRSVERLRLEARLALAVAARAPRESPREKPQSSARRARDRATPRAHDALSAALIERAGFNAGFMSVFASPPRGWRCLTPV